MREHPHDILRPYSIQIVHIIHKVYNYLHDVEIPPSWLPQHMAVTLSDGSETRDVSLYLNTLRRDLWINSNSHVLVYNTKRRRRYKTCSRSAYEKHVKSKFSRTTPQFEYVSKPCLSKYLQDAKNIR